MINIKYSAVRFIFSVIVCIAVGIAAYYIVERPLTKKLSKKSVDTRREKFKKPC